MTTTQKTPRQVLKLAQERRQSSDRRRVIFDYPSNLVAQVLTTYDGQPLTFKPARNVAVEAYATGSKIDIRRAPSGIAHTKSV